MMSSQEHIEKYLNSEPQYITAESVRQNKQKRTESPDNDSAFCDNTSSNSDSSQEKVKLKLNLSTETENESVAKAEKIKLAIEKIKEASIKKIFIKVCSQFLAILKSTD